MSHWQDVIKKLSSYSIEHGLFEPGDSILIALSGGADSVFLVHALAELRPKWDLRCSLAHVNYRRRGDDSEEDEMFCKRLAADYDWPLEVLRIRDEEAASAQKENFQAWARERRYRFLSELCRTLRCQKIVVAHHLTDQVETFLLRLLRGSGPTGLGGMSPQTELYETSVVRPLLALSRQDIEHALADRKLPFRHDASNDMPLYRRNRLRHEILPRLSQIVPAYERAVGDSLWLLQQDNATLDKQARQELDRLRFRTPNGAGPAVCIKRSGLQTLPLSLRLRLLRLMIGELTGGPQSITFHHVRKIEELAVSKVDSACYDLPGRLLYDQGALTVTIRKKKQSE